ncbi:MAG: hypothetical protein L0Y57_13585 [Beijerinckiaceae bacterium]|nr:hypothetical protein [Beijerinckiaceae bacterium]
MPKTKGHLRFPRPLLWAADAVVILYLILDGIATPLIRPLLRWVAGLVLVLRLQDIVASLPPYVILLLLAFPIAVAEPAKIYALYLMSQGYLYAGCATLAAAYLLSLVVAERIYRAGEERLRTIAWFANFMDWLIDIREQLLAWVRATPLWAISTKIRRRARELAGKFLIHLRAG